MSASDALSRQFHQHDPDVEFVPHSELPAPAAQTRTRAEMAELRHDIATYGMHTPITLTKHGDIDNGNHRARIARSLRLKAVPVRRLHF